MTINIPDGSTNADVYRIVYGYYPLTDSVICNDCCWCGKTEPCQYCNTNDNRLGDEEDWWNKTYKSN